MFTFIYTAICFVSVDLGIAMLQDQSTTYDIPYGIYLVFALILVLTVLGFLNIICIHRRSPRAPQSARQFMAVFILAPFIVYGLIYVATANTPEIREFLLQYNNGPDKWVNLSVFVLISAFIYRYWLKDAQVQATFGSATLKKPSKIPNGIILTRIISAAMLLTGLGYLAAIMLNPPQDEKTFLPQHITFAAVYLAKWIFFGAMTLFFTAPAKLEDKKNLGPLALLLSIWAIIAAAFACSAMFIPHIYYYFPHLYHTKLLALSEFTIVFCILWYVAGQMRTAGISSALTRAFEGPVLGLIGLCFVFATGLHEFAAVVTKQSFSVAACAQGALGAVICLGPLAILVAYAKQTPAPKLRHLSMLATIAALACMFILSLIFWYKMYNNPTAWGASGGPQDMLQHIYGTLSFTIESYLPLLVVFALLALYFKGNATPGTKHITRLIIRGAACCYIGKGLLPALAIVLSALCNWNIGGVFMLSGKEFSPIHDTAILYLPPALLILALTSVKYKGCNAVKKTVFACITLLVLATILPLIQYVGWFITIYGPELGVPYEISYFDAAMHAVRMYRQGQYFSIYESASVVNWAMIICAWAYSARSLNATVQED
ncbi:hypothetical protein LJB93_00940 [Desulfovibrio sp. OttesenSCG-928-F07]|nr:hypothetical protein [Desulfovibrio sp. OttesenSCG-928-F07]